MRIMFDVCLFACFPVSLLSLMCISFFVNLSLFCLMWIKEIFCGDSRYYHIKAIWLWNFVTGNHKTFKIFRSLSIFHQTILVSFLFVYVRFVLSFFCICGRIRASQNQSQSLNHLITLCSSFLLQFFLFKVYLNNHKCLATVQF